MIDEKFVFVGVILNLIGGLSYLIDTILGKTKPNKVTWLLWALAPLIAFTAEIKQGVGLASLMTFMVGFNPLLIFLASFVNKKSSWKINRFDIACGALSMLGIILWIITRVGNVAILFSIAADALAGIPTVIKSYKAPETESYLIYLMAAVSALITLLTIDVWNFQHWGFPLYILLLAMLIFVLIRFKIGKRMNL